MTVTPKTNLAPPSLAPFASASAASPGIDGPVLGIQDAPHQVVDLGVGPLPLDLPRREHRGGDPERGGEVDAGEVLLHPRRRARNRERTDLPEPGVMTGLGPQALVRGHVEPRQRGEDVRPTHLRDEPGGVPGRPAGQARPLEHDDVADAETCQVVRDRRPDDPAADHHDPRSSGRLGHGREHARIEVTVGQVLGDRHGDEA